MSIFKKSKTLRQLVSKNLISHLEKAVNESNSFYKEFNLGIIDSSLWQYCYKVEPNIALNYEENLKQTYPNRGFVVERDYSINDHDAKATLHLNAPNSMMDTAALFHANTLLAKEVIESAIGLKQGVRSVLFSEQVMGRCSEAAIYVAISEDISKLLYETGFICQVDYFTNGKEPSKLFNLESLLDDPIVASGIMSSIVKNMMGFESDSRIIERVEEYLASILLSILHSVGREGYIFTLKDRYNLMLTEYDHSTRPIDVDKNQLDIDRHEFSKLWDKWS